MKTKVLFGALLLALPQTVAVAQNRPADAANPDWQSEIPRVIHPEKDLVDLYEKTWEIAADRVRKGPEGIPFSPYLDENCYEDQIWIWDACFMVMFSKYAPNAFPGNETLNNLYLPIHDSVPTPLRIHLRDNPPLFAWVEYESYIFNGDRERVDYVLRDHKYLQRHFDFFNTVPVGNEWPAVSPNGIHRGVVEDDAGKIAGFTWTGGASGMDNTVRGRDAGGYDKILWIDAVSQQALSALYISRLLDEKNEKEEARKWQAKYDELKTLVNTRYWDERDRFYYDVKISDGTPCRIKTPASFWPMLAEIPTKKQAADMVKVLTDENVFGGEYPWPTLSRDDQDYNHLTGDYWRGGIWLPMVYMGTKALEKYGYYEVADDYAGKVIRQMARTYKAVTPHTIWECYSPSKDEPSTEHGRRARPDFCGWSALGPISLFIENVLGFRTVDALDNRVEWTLKAENGTHGITNLHFGAVNTDIVYDAAARSVNVKSNKPYSLIINGKSYKVKAGENQLKAVALL